MIKWDDLTHWQRLAILQQTNLPTSLASARWQQLTEDERTTLMDINWFPIIGESESQESKHCDAGYINDVRFGTSDD